MIGRVLDASALDAIMAGHPEALVRLAAARATSSPLWVPALALTEVRALRPGLLEPLFDLLEHPSIIRRDLDPATAEEVGELLATTGTFDTLAGHVCIISRRRSWPVLTTDPGRLHRIDPDVAVTAFSMP